MALFSPERGQNIGTGIARAMQMIGAIGHPRMQAGLLDRWGEDSERLRMSNQYRGLLGGMELNERQRGLLSALPAEKGLGLLAEREFAGPEKPTSVMQNLVAAGLQPGTQEYQKAMLDYVQKPGVTVNTGGPKLPSGFMWKDPNNPAAGVVPIPGSTQDPGAQVRDPAREKEFRKRGEDIGRIDEALNTYSTLIRKHGAEVLPGETRAQLDTAYNDLMMELKELWNLGVLQGPDLAIMQRALTPPTGTKGQVYEWFGGKGVFESQLNLVRRKIEAAKRRLRQQQAGGGAPEQSGPADNDPLGIRQ